MEQRFHVGLQVHRGHRLGDPVGNCGYANELLEARDQQGLSRVVARWARVELMIADELCYVSLPATGAELLFQVMAERSERASVIVTTNLPFSEWTNVFPDPRLCKAVVERLTYRSHIIETGTESFRFKASLAKSGERPGKEHGARHDRQCRPHPRRHLCEPPFRNDTRNDGLPCLRSRGCAANWTAAVLLRRVSSGRAPTTPSDIPDNGSPHDCAEQHHVRVPIMRDPLPGGATVR